MHATRILEEINHQLTIRSGLDQHRDYLGISKISDCPRVAVHEYMHGPTLTQDAHRMCFAGYEHERSLIEMLAQAGMIKLTAVEVVAPFDPRLRGHIDSLTIDGDLLEIKSVTCNKFHQVIETGRSCQRHYMQVQLYMRYGGWQHAHIVYRCRETYEHTVIHVPYNQTKAERYENKAKLMLQYIDSGELPPCECGRC